MDALAPDTLHGLLVKLGLEADTVGEAALAGRIDTLPGCETSARDLQTKLGQVTCQRDAPQATIDGKRPAERLYSEQS